MTAVSAAADELALTFAVAGDDCIGILHGVTAAARCGVVVIVGGPQYRVGSHRQFVLLARALAAGGVPVLRFDYRGLGDSSGTARDFTDVDNDIRGAIDTLCARAGTERVVLWGLCDAASAALMYAHGDPRVAGLALLNPWVHSPATDARVRLQGYYRERLRSPEFWRKLARFQFDWRDSLASIRAHVGALRSPAAQAPEHFIARMRKGWDAFDGPVLLILSGEDFTAAEFRLLCATAPEWRSLLTAKPVDVVTIDAANHTFARADWRQAVASATLDWLRGSFSDQSAQQPIGLRQSARGKWESENT